MVAVWGWRRPKNGYQPSLCYSLSEGYALVPLKMYLKNGYAKVLIGLGKGKKKYDKREDLKKKEAKRDIERAFRERQKM